MPRFRDPAPSTDLEARYALGFPLWSPRRGDEGRALVSDPWGYISYAIGNLASGNRAQQARAFWEQAEDFYWAVEDSRPSARPLLYYYSFMNMVKALLIVRGVALTRERHGIRHERPARQKSQIQTQELVVETSAGGNTALFSELARLLGHTFQNDQRLKVGQLLEQIVGVHRPWMAVTNSKSKFARATVTLRKSQEGPDVFAEIRFSAKDKSIAEAVAGRSGWTRVRAGDAGSIYFETPPQRRQGRSYQSAVEQLVRALDRTGMHVILTRGDGYRIYFSDLGRTEGQRLPQLITLYAIMFFLGAITRYRPYDFDRFVAGRWGWLVNEFINSQPQQFVYLMASELVRNEVVVPYGYVTFDSI